MRMVDIIEKKRNGLSLTKEEIDYFISGYVAETIPDYQVSALLMAIYFQKMNDDELTNLTFAMLNSGEKIDLSKINGVKVDKHSTGGVGDKTSLVVAPLAAAAGVKMAKMSGRGLGHTGGTLDKLESIPGFKIEQDVEEFYKQVNDIGLAIIGQSANITPADRKLYALRDVTGTVESIGLIASSIMSKKLASGADHIVLDVKVGEGAFMKNVDSARELAKKMVRIGKLAGVDTVATLTDMSQPLGCAVGNSLEVIEAIDTLKGKGPKDFTELCYALTSEILLIAKVCKTEKEAYALIDKLIEDRSGLEKLSQMIERQGGNKDVINNYNLFEQATNKLDIRLDNLTDEYVEKIDALAIGEAAMLVGAGRQTKDDIIDHSVGIVLNKKVGDKISPNDVVATLYYNDVNPTESVEKIKSAYKLSKKMIKKHSIIIDICR